MRHVVYPRMARMYADAQRPAPAAKRPVWVRDGRCEHEPCRRVARVHTVRFSLHAATPRRRTSALSAVIRGDRWPGRNPVVSQSASSAQSADDPRCSTGATPARCTKGQTAVATRTTPPRNLACTTSRAERMAPRSTARDTRNGELVSELVSTCSTCATPKFRRI